MCAVQEFMMVPTRLQVLPKTFLFYEMTDLHDRLIQFWIIIAAQSLSYHSQRAHSAT